MTLTGDQDDRHVFPLRRERRAVIKIILIDLSRSCSGFREDREPILPIESRGVHGVKR